MNPRGTRAGPYAERAKGAKPSKKTPQFATMPMHATESMQLKLFEPSCSTVLAFTRLRPLTCFSPRLGDQVNCLKLTISLCRPIASLNRDLHGSIGY